MPIFYVLYNLNMLFPSVCLVNERFWKAFIEQLTCLQEKDVRPDGRNLEEFRPTVLNMGKYMSRVVRKPALCICENKDADQLRRKLISAFVFATEIVQSL